MTTRWQCSAWKIPVSEARINTDPLVTTGGSGGCEVPVPWDHGINTLANHASKISRSSSENFAATADIMA